MCSSSSRCSSSPAACAGCGETPYLKLLSQLFGDPLLVDLRRNLPVTPWTRNGEGGGPAWSNSLFEDNAEFGFGMRLAIDKNLEQASELLVRLASGIGDDLVTGLLKADQSTEAGIAEQRQRVAALRAKLAGVPGVKAYVQNLPVIRIGGQVTKSQYQFSVQGADADELYHLQAVIASLQAPAPTPASKAAP